MDASYVRLADTRSATNCLENVSLPWMLYSHGSMQKKCEKVKKKDTYFITTAIVVNENEI